MLTMICSKLLDYDTMMILMMMTRTVVMMVVSDEVTEVARAAELGAGGALNNLVAPLTKPQLTSLSTPGQ